MLPKRLLALILFAALAVMPSCVLRAQWVQINGKGGASVTSLAVSGTTIFAGTNNGIVLSTDNGVTWRAADSGLNDKNITNLYASGSNVFAGTYVGGSNYGSIYRWSLDSAIWKLAAEVPWSQLYAFTALGPYLYAVGDEAMAMSTDMGITWEMNDSSLRNFHVRSLTALSTLLFAGSNLGIIYSLDFGNSWQTTGDTIFDSTYIVSLAAQGNYLFASAESYVSADTTHSGIFRSTDYGVSWSHVYKNRGVIASAFYVTGSKIYSATNGGILLSTDSGTSWTMLNAGLTNRNDQAISANGTTLFAGTQGDGIFRSSDSGLTWVASNTGLAGVIIRKLFHTGTSLLAGEEDASNYYDGGVVRSTNEGDSWESVNPDSATQDAVSFTACDGKLFMGTGSGFYVSSNDGLTWELRNAGLSSYDAVFACAAIGDNLFAGTNGSGIFHSADTGKNWTLLDSGLGNGVRVFNFAVKGDTLFAASYNGIFRSIDSGTLWERVDKGLTDTDIFGLGIVGNDLFAADVNYHGVLRSTDDGESWEEVNTGLPHNTFAYTFVVSGTNLFVGVEGGIYLTTDLGESWTAENEGLQYGSQGAYVGNLTMGETYLFATSYSNDNSSNGVWRRPLSDFGISSVGQTLAEIQPGIRAYPNPLSQSTTISFTSETAGYADVSIVNLLGIEVAHLFSGDLAAGEHSFVWNCTGALPCAPTDGMYECLVRMNGRVETLPVVIVR